MAGSREEDLKISNEFSLYDLYGHSLGVMNPWPGGHEIYYLDDPSLFIIITYLVCFIYAWE